MPKIDTTYDYIIAGAGCAGLSLAARLVSNERLKSKRILIVDREEKRHNDRTWCFWEKDSGFFEPVVCKSWDALDFVSSTLSRRLDIRPYHYKMIRSADFYRYCNDLLARSGQVDRFAASIDSFATDADGATLSTDSGTYRAKHIFNSTLNGISFDRKPYIFLRQHFRGWTIRFARDVFDPGIATLMDFRVSQEQGTAFFYVLPLSLNRALVEYTLFTKDVLPSEAYTQSLEQYIRNRITSHSYTIEDQEDGVIPMTNYPFKSRTGNVINIGTAGGHTKASTGYTFEFIQKGTASIVNSLAETAALPQRIGTHARRFGWYDSILLRVLSSNTSSGADLFTRIFKVGDPTSVLRFLDNESIIAEELSIMARMPKRTFLNAAVEEMVGRLRS